MRSSKKFSDETADLWGHYGHTGGATKTHRCYESHPPLKVGEHVIYGGSCITPSVKDADVYIGFDHGMSFNYSPKPWMQSESAKQVVEALYYIPDMGVPPKVAEFKLMVTWVAAQLVAGKKVHVGCIGGHGRTGTFLSALVAEVTGNKQSIEYVRKNYCAKAVESSAQVKFLQEHYGVEVAKGTKDFGSSGSSYGSSYGSGWSSHGSKSGRSSSNYPFASSAASFAGSKATDTVTAKGKAAVRALDPLGFRGSTRKIDPVPSARDLWSVPKKI